MNEAKAMIGILLIAVIATTGFIAFSNGSTGAAIQQNYASCCCNILTQSNEPQYLIRSQIQTFAVDCKSACKRYADEGKVFGQEGLCQDDS